MKKVITHPGRFHADELVAIAWLMISGIAIDVSRREPTIEDLEDPDTIVIDIGGVYNPDLNNFDHHQDPDLPASCNLVIKHFCDDEEMFKILEESLLNHVSNVDRGIDFTTRGVPCINSIVRTYTDFSSALMMMTSIIKSYREFATRLLEGKDHWKYLKKKNHVAYNLEGHFIPNWREYATKEDIHYMITPGRKDETFNVIATDIVNHPVLSTLAQSYRHPSGLMAVYDSLDAIIIETNEFVSQIKESF